MLKRSAYISLLHLRLAYQHSVILWPMLTPRQSLSSLLTYTYTHEHVWPIPELE